VTHSVEQTLIVAFLIDQLLIEIQTSDARDGRPKWVSGDEGHREVEKRRFSLRESEQLGGSQFRNGNNPEILSLFFRLALT
jgi:hypothetical protein